MMVTATIADAEADLEERWVRGLGSRQRLSLIADAEADLEEKGKGVCIFQVCLYMCNVGVCMYVCMYLYASFLLKYYCMDRMFCPLTETNTIANAKYRRSTNASTPRLPLLSWMWTHRYLIFF
jgi:hypothetical protein